MIYTVSDFFEAYVIGRATRHAFGSKGTDVHKLLKYLLKFNWALALLIAGGAAVVFRCGYAEVAAAIWLLSLILVLPMWNHPRR